MSQTAEATPELVAKSADYFAANSDVSYLVVIVSTEQFYRPEREDLATSEASAANSAAVRIYRHQLTPEPAPVTFDPNAEVPEFPAVVGIVELMLAKVKTLEGATPRQLAEVIYLAAVQQGMEPKDAEAMMQAVADWLGEQLAIGLESISLRDAGKAATLVAELADAPALPATTAPAVTTPPAVAAADQSAPASPEQLAPALPAAAPTATLENKVTKKPAAKTAKVKASPKKKASTAAKAA